MKGLVSVLKITYSHDGKEVVRTIANDAVLIGRGDGTGAPDLDLSPGSSSTIGWAANRRRFSSS